MEKYGFVYIWRDRKHKRYYVGCRWGFEDDGYICSSVWMKNSYKRRPEDFTRRIISKIYTNRKDLLLEEYKWLSMIRKEELGTKYYNLHNNKAGHWSTDKKKYVKVAEKISNAWTPERRKKMSESKMGDKNPMANPSIARIVGDKNKGRAAPNKGIPQSTKQKEEHSKRMKGRAAPNKGIPMSEEQKTSLSKNWKIINPRGESIIITNLAKYCKENNLIAGNMMQIANGIRNSHRGFKCERI